MNPVRDLVSNGMSDETRERLLRPRSSPALDRLQRRVDALSSGDRIIFYAFAVLLCVASLSGLYALEQSLLVEVPSYGGTLVEGAVGSPRFINPLLAISDADRDLSVLTYAGLMGLSGTGELVSVLAESYRIAEDGKTYTFTLRDNAKFSDGTPVTADDIVFTVKKAQNPALKSPEYANWSGVIVEAVDAHTVVFKLSKSYAPFLGLTTLGILPARLWQKVSNEEFPFSTLETNPVGAGPFVVDGISRDASGLIQSVSLTKNSRYVLGQPYLNGIRFNFYSSYEDLADALASGAVESAYDLPAEQAPQMLTAPYARVFGVFWNPSEKQVYARAEVRKALSLALDRHKIIADVLGGYATPIMGPVPPGGSVQQVPVPASEHPAEAAAAVLETAGWKYDGSSRVWENAGSKQTLDGITLRTSNVPELKNVASAVKADWEKLGISVNIELYEPGDLSQNVIRPRKYEALLYGMVIGRDQDLYAFWDSQERNDPGLNISLYANKTVDALLESTRVSVDQSVRASNLQKIEDLIAADYPAAFLYAPNFTYTMPDGLRGVLLPQIIMSADRFATAASWYKMTDAVWPFFAK
ncbi:MAG: Extracellular solute-binding protein family 5 [Parcubacteria group bacterium GW2011_GWA1_54_9]|nr:MAG: Extracellular solute-binding protein family 5 [Parcubacteria group bacterium GW2011_GWA1_54_9]